MNKHFWIIVLVVIVSVLLILRTPLLDELEPDNQLRPDGWNVILIQADTLRADHLGAYGYPQAQTPNLDALAAEGALFEHHIVNATYTACSVPSLLTGNYQDRHGLWFQGDSLAESNTTLPERLLQLGYNTAGFFSNPVVHPDRGYTQGIKSTLNLKSSHDAKVMVNHALKWLNKNSNDPFFLWLLLIDPHFPYTPPIEYVNRFSEAGTLEKSLSWAWEFDHDKVTWDMESLLWGDLTTPETTAREMAMYDAEIAFLDAQIGRLLTYLDKEGLRDNTLIVFTSDHGEEFAEHTFFCSHGHSTYEAVARVPLIIDAPNAPPTRISQVVRTIDIAPTILSLLNIPDNDTMDGRSLDRLVKGEETTLPLLPAYTTNAPIHEGFFKKRPRMYVNGVEGAWRSVRTEEWKLIRIPHPVEDLYELYNVKTDPEEQYNRYAANPEKASELLDMLIAIEKRSGAEALNPVQTELDEDTQEMLESLGYIGE